VLNAAGIGVTSDVLAMDASKNPLAPIPGLAVGVVKARLWAGEIVRTAVGEGEGVTNADETIPVLTDGPARTVPRPTLPLTVMRTGGRR
jgi:hypothetical protein